MLENDWICDIKALSLAWVRVSAAVIVMLISRVMRYPCFDMCTSVDARHLGRWWEVDADV